MTEQNTPKMTHDEMIDTLKGLVFGSFDRTTAKEREALDMAIKALSQEPIAQERYEDLCEYFGGVEDFLKNRDDFKAWLERVKWHIHKAEELYEKYEQEPKYCDRNICVSNEYNGIGCDECEVTKSQEPKVGE